MGLHRGTLRLLFITALISLSFTAIAQQSPAPGAQRDARIAELEREVAELQREVAELREILQTLMGSGTEVPYMVANAVVTRESGAFYDPVTGLNVGLVRGTYPVGGGSIIVVTFPGETQQSMTIHEGQTLYFEANEKTYTMVVKKAQRDQTVEFSIIEVSE